MKKDHLKIYLRFLSLEIPNIIQILGVVSLFGFFIQNLYITIPLSVVSGFLLHSYFFARLFDFLKEQIVDQYSETNSQNLSLDVWSDYGFFILMTSIFFVILNSAIVVGVALTV